VLRAGYRSFKREPFIDLENRDALPALNENYGGVLSAGIAETALVPVATAGNRQLVGQIKDSREAAYGKKHTDKCYCIAEAPSVSCRFALFASGTPNSPVQIQSSRPFFLLPASGFLLCLILVMN
jgi:hypothetical protein